MDATRLSGLIEYVIRAHDERAKGDYKRFRIWDKKTPYSIHPIWSAMTLLTETSLPENLRYEGAEALLLHDILEDTDAPLPPCSGSVERLVKELTFKNSAESMQLIFERSDEAKLLKIYDKVSNFLDGAWMDPDKKEKNLEHIKKLSDMARERFGELNILKIARSLSD